MNENLMTWVAGISIAGFLYLLYRNWIMSHAINTLWLTFKSEAERMDNENIARITVLNAVVESFIKSIEQFDERLGIVEKQSGETE